MNEKILPGHFGFESQLDTRYAIDGDVDGYFCPGSGGRTYPHRKKKLGIARETGDLEAETGEQSKKPDIGRVVESYFILPNEYSNSIILTDSDFILTDRTCAIAITADMSFKTALAADFERECKNIEFLWKQRPGIGGVAALPPAVSQIPGKHLCFLVTRATEKSYELLYEMFSAVPERTKEELESILGRKFMGYVSGNFSDFERQKQRGSTATDYNTVEENDEVPEVVMLLTALINILGHYGERGVLDRPNIRVMRWRNGALSGSDLATEPGLGSSRTYQPGEMPLPPSPSLG